MDYNINLRVLLTSKYSERILDKYEYLITDSRWKPEYTSMLNKDALTKYLKDLTSTTIP